MRYNKDIHNRQSIRLKGYNYSQEGAYFVTVFTKNRVCLFGDVIKDKMILNIPGEIVKKCWISIPSHYANVSLDYFMIMPNHVHGIILINYKRVQNIEPLQSLTSNVRAQDIEPQKEILQKQNRYQNVTKASIGSIIRGFKIGATKWFRKNTDIKNVWHRNYYEHVIRNETDLNNIREYIIYNPLKWETDEENPTYFNKNNIL